MTVLLDSLHITSIPYRQQQSEEVKVFLALFMFNRMGYQSLYKLDLQVALKEAIL